MMQYSLSLDSDTLSAGALLVREEGGAVRAARRKEILTVARELVNVDELHGQNLSQPRLVKDSLRLRLNAALEHEVCGLILLDGQHRLIDYLEPFRGTINQASVYPREIMKIALHRNALSVFLVHNHPSGLAEVSQANIALTKHLKQATIANENKDRDEALALAD